MYSVDTNTFNFTFEKRHVNYWRSLAGLFINLEVFFEKLEFDESGSTAWHGVKKNDLAVPVSGLFNSQLSIIQESQHNFPLKGLCTCLWRDIDIRINQVRY